MIYIESKDAGKNILNIKGELYKYLIKIRHHTVNDELIFRNSNNLTVAYRYVIYLIEPKHVKLKLIDSLVKEIKPKRYLHVGWCVIDTKSIEKVLPSLNEIGISKISFIYCDRSQKNFKLDFNRFTRILKSSSSQCGRTDIMEFEIIKNLEIFIQKYPSCIIFDFCDNILQSDEEFDTILIGCEGGFSAKEKVLISRQRVYQLDTSMILRSETAVISIASKVLL